jgi:hypothetical protein
MTEMRVVCFGNRSTRGGRDITEAKVVWIESTYAQGSKDRVLFSTSLPGLPSCTVSTKWGMARPARLLPNLESPTPPEPFPTGDPEWERTARRHLVLEVAPGDPFSIGYSTRVTHFLRKGERQPPVPAFVREVEETGEEEVIWCPFKASNSEYADLESSMREHGGDIVSRIEADKLYPERVHGVQDRLFLFAWFTELPLRWFQDPDSAGMDDVEPSLPSRPNDGPGTRLMAYAIENVYRCLRRWGPEFQNDYFRDLGEALAQALDWHSLTKFPSASARACDRWFRSHVTEADLADRLFQGETISEWIKRHYGDSEEPDGQRRALDAVLGVFRGGIKDRIRHGKLFPRIPSRRVLSTLKEDRDAPRQGILSGTADDGPTYLKFSSDGYPTAFAVPLGRHGKWIVVVPAGTKPSEVEEYLAKVTQEDVAFVGDAPCGPSTQAPASPAPGGSSDAEVPPPPPPASDLAANRIGIAAHTSSAPSGADQQARERILADIRVKPPESSNTGSGKGGTGNWRVPLELRWHDRDSEEHDDDSPEECDASLANFLRFVVLWILSQGEGHAFVYYGGKNKERTRKTSLQAITYGPARRVSDSSGEDSGALCNVYFPPGSGNRTQDVKRAASDMLFAGPHHKAEPDVSSRTAKRLGQILNKVELPEEVSFPASGEKCVRRIRGVRLRIDGDARDWLEDKEKGPFAWRRGNVEDLKDSDEKLLDWYERACSSTLTAGEQEADIPPGEV